ncbi:peptidase [Vibrio sinaloensis DSM 21326]|uniref:Peptidase n=1 Tax=Vibrio sinaloensis DSM 21326 TaxID=945550 RepID=E8M2K1_PHOS4|nr:M48 family metallopeptidase [Vibrio sinaloensis]EGA71828.1 peptidase [Vibrio sinaloensis DSM 21326]
MRFQGSAFPPGSSVRHSAELEVNGTKTVVLVTNQERLECDSNWIDVSVPVGNLPIRITFPEGWMFVVERSPQVSRWLKQQKKASIIDSVESNALAWVFSALICIGFIVGSYVYVLPWLSEKTANAVPDSVAIVLGEKVLSSFDEHWQPSQLSAQTQTQIRDRLDQHLQQLEPLPYSVELVFRSSDMGANAFALPGGKIIVLDDMVKLAANEQQLDSILLHELGHVHHKHMLKKLVHSSLLSVGVSLMTGESSGVIDNLAGVGVFLLTNGHSREAEEQADQYAKQGMLTIYGSSQPMVEMFERFQTQHEFELPQWLSSHPDFEQRIDAVRE